MDTPGLEDRFLTAGREFGNAMEALGFDLASLCWAYDTTEKRHVLVVITDAYDVRGPLEVSQALFAAYNASVTPKEIDPFTIRLHSTSQPFGHGFADATGWKASDVTNLETGEVFPPGDAEYQYGDLIFREEWVLKQPSLKSRKPLEINRRWHRFQRNLEARAA